MKIGILGSGDVARKLGAGLAAHGHSLLMGSATPAKFETWLAGLPAAPGSVKAGSFADAAAFADLVVLAVKGTAAVAVVQAVAAALAGKPVMDATNPIADLPPVNGVLQYFTGPNESLMESLQTAVPAAHFVKAFNSVGNAQMVHPQLAGGPPSMFIAGNNAAAKTSVSALLLQLGWLTVDMGQAEAARAIEPLCMLWCIPGFLRNEWSHAFKLLQPA